MTGERNWLRDGVERIRARGHKGEGFMAVILRPASSISKPMAETARIAPFAIGAALALTISISSPSLAYEVTGDVAGGGTISGQVVFHGTVPMKSVIVNKDPAVCGASREDPLLVVGPGQGVAETIVYLAEVPSGKAWPADGKKPVLDNVKCRFEPAIQVIQPGSLDVGNKDPVLHNTHGYYGKRTAFNLALPNQDQNIATELMKTGTVRADCDAHGWMEGWVIVRDNPYYAITGADG
jgi:hypothetical protein